MAKVLISVPDELLARIDREVASLGGSRSGFIQEAARRRLGWAAPEEIDGALARGRSALASAGKFESVDLIRADRDRRDDRDRSR
ncbi:MAG TPA: ribbon-helix-helix protein, CopG family [Solirubrobacterales bacterium]|nr:ribbon-helix-helix protein, CopG family [Solirubrobacterales bacterium]